MAIFSTYFRTAYTGQLIYNMTNYSISEGLKNYVESVEIVYDNIFDRKLSGFSDVNYLQNAIDLNENTGKIQITFTNDVAPWLIGSLIKLAKGVLSSGMNLIFSDWVTDESYYCIWDNAGEFIEQSPVLSGASMFLKFWHVGLIFNYQDTYEISALAWQDTYEETALTHLQGAH